MARLGEAVGAVGRTRCPTGEASVLEAPLDLARHPPAPARARPRAPLHDPLRQQPPPGRAPGRRAQRAGRRGDRPRPPRLDRARAAPGDRGRAQGRPPAARSSPPRRSSSGIDMGAVDLVVQIETPPSVASGMQRIGRASHQVEAVSRGRHLPEVPRRPAGERRGHEGDARGRGRGDARTRATRSTCSPSRSWRWSPSASAGGRALRPRAPRRARSRPWPGAVRGRARHALGPLPVGRVRGAAAARHLGPPRGASSPREGAQRLVVRTPAPSPTAGSTASSSPTARAGRARRRARRGDGLREPRRRGLRPRRHRAGASWRSRATACSSRPRPASPGKMPFWKGDRRRAAGRAGPRDRPPHPRARSPRRARRRPSACSATTTSTRGRAEPARLPRGPARGDRRPARRPHDRPRAHARRDGRLAAVPALALGRARPRAVGDRPRGAPAAGGRGRRRDDLERRRHRPPAARARAPAGGRGPPARAGGDRGPRGRASSGARASSPRASARRRRARCCCRAAGRASARRCGCSASAPPTCWRSPRATRRSRSCSRPTASACATCSTCRRSWRSPPACGGARSASSRWTRQRPVALRGLAALRLRRQLPLRRRRPARRAARAGAGRRPGASCASCSASPSCASSSTGRPSTSWSWRCSASTRPTRPRAPSGCTTCCCASATSRGTRRRRACARCPTATPRPPRTRGSARSSASGAPSGSASRARSAGPPPRTRGACATRSASPRRRAFPRLSSSGSPTRSARSCRAMPAPTARSPPTEVARRYATGEASVLAALAELAKDGRVLEGEFRPGGHGREWCEADVLATLRRRSLAALRKQVEPAEPTALARLLADWQGVARAPATRRGPDALLDVVEQLQGAAFPASILEREVLPARVPGYRPGGPRHPVRGRRGGLGRPRRARRPRRSDRPLPDRRPAAPPAAASRGAAGRRPRADSRAPRPSGGVVLRGSPRRGRGRAGPAGRGRAVGPGLGGRGHERHAGGAARLPGGARRRAEQGAIGWRGSARVRQVPPSAVGRWSLLPSPRRAPSATERTTALAEQLLKRHGVLTRDAVAFEEVPGRVLGRLPGAEGPRGGRPHPPRLFRGRPRRPAVRGPRRPRPARGPSASPTPTRRSPSSSRPPTPRTPTAPRSPGRRARTLAWRGRRAPTSSSWTGRWRRW